MFFGTFEHSLDDKGRMVLPSAFRADLAGGGVIAPWDRCLGLWTPDEFDRVAQVVKAKIAAGDADQDAMRVLFADARSIKPDAQGRVFILQDHRDRAGLDRDTVVLGQFDHVEIWAKDAWREVHGHTTPTLHRVISNLRI